jgi:hypothetical protein
MLHTDSLTGGQFFAALRLVLHAASGKGVDRTLAFVQGACCGSTSQPNHITFLSVLLITLPCSPPKLG